MLDQHLLNTAVENTRVHIKTHPDTLPLKSNLLVLNAAGSVITDVIRRDSLYMINTHAHARTQYDYAASFDSIPIMTEAKKGFIHNCFKYNLLTKTFRIKLNQVINMI